MSFYNTLAKHYSDLFPLNEDHLTLFDLIIKKDSTYGLDIGCATGILTHALQNYIPIMVGIDLSDTMIALANKHNQSGINFKMMDMTQITSVFEPSTFDVVTCLGNTLPHVSHEHVKKLLHDIYVCLKQDGQLLIQVVHYDLMLKEKRRSLPTITNQNVEFQREYIYFSENSPILFKARLIDLHTHKSFKVETTLYPFTSSQIKEWLNEFEFEITHEFGAWNMSLYDENASPSYIIIAKKK